jgi:hypothetical protein
MAKAQTTVAIHLLGLLLCGVIVMPAFATERRAAAKSATKAPEPTPVVEVVQPPPKPLTLEQQPASPPQISYKGGQLTIMARNSTLGDILRGVRAQTGAAVDVPPNATERVVGNFGPGPAREVLAELLNGSHFNYVMLGSTTNPDGLVRLILTQRVGGPAEPAVAQYTQPVAAAPPPPAEPQETDTNADADFSDDQADQSGDDFQDQNPDADANQQQQEPLQQQGAPTPQPGVRSPEQLLRELQQRQLLLQQQQQQGTPPQAQPPGFPVPQGQPPQPPQE